MLYSTFSLFLGSLVACEKIYEANDFAKYVQTKIILTFKLTRYIYPLRKGLIKALDLKCTFCKFFTDMLQMEFVFN